MYAYARGIAKSLTEKVTAILKAEDKLETPLSRAFNTSLQSPADALWARILTLYDWTIMECVKADMLGKDYHFTKRKNGGEWDVYGREQYDGDHPMFVGMNNIKYFRHYRIHYSGIANESPNGLSISQDLALYNVTEGKLENVSKENENFLLENGYITDINGILTAAFPIVPQKLFVDHFDEKAVSDYREKYPEIEKLTLDACEILKTYALYCEKEIKNDAPDFLKDNKAQIGFALTTCLFHARGVVLEEALGTGFIKYDPDADHCMLGAFMTK
jgi:hypothetical protein